MRWGHAHYNTIDLEAEAADTHHGVVALAQRNCCWPSGAKQAHAAGDGGSEGSQRKGNKGKDGIHACGPAWENGHAAFVQVPAAWYLQGRAAMIRSVTLPQPYAEKPDMCSSSP